MISHAQPACCPAGALKIIWICSALSRQNISGGIARSKNEGWRQLDMRGFRRFELIRYEDKTGISGIGKIAEGVIFSSGKCALAWTIKDIPSVTIYDSVEQVIAIHGHDGKTELKWIDSE